MGLSGSHDWIAESAHFAEVQDGSEYSVVVGCSSLASLAVAA